MNTQELKIEEIFDVLILKHGFDNHNRDYLFQIETNWTNGRNGNYILRFKDCIDSHIQLNTSEYNSLDWSGTAVMAYPGFQEINDSKKALDLGQKIGLELKEIQLDTVLFKLTMIVSDFELKKLNNNSELIDHFVYKID